MLDRAATGQHPTSDSGALLRKTMVTSGTMTNGSTGWRDAVCGALAGSERPARDPGAPDHHGKDASNGAFESPDGERNRSVTWRQRTAAAGRAAQAADGQTARRRYSSRVTASSHSARGRPSPCAARSYLRQRCELLVVAHVRTHLVGLSCASRESIRLSCFRSGSGLASRTLLRTAHLGLAPGRSAASWDASGAFGGAFCDASAGLEVWVNHVGQHRDLPSPIRATPSR